MKREILDAIRTARRDKRPLALATDMASGAQSLIDGASTTGDLEVGPEIAAAASDALRDDRSRTIDTPAGAVFVQAFNPPLRMMIVGAVHISQALAPMAEIAGYDVTIIDPRGAFATELRFPGISITHEWPDDAMADLKPDRRTAIVTLTHDPKLDDPALEVALRSDAFYVGSLGSTRTHAARLKRLAKLGFGDDDFARINGPIGLPIGAKSPAEIAVAILAQVTEALRAGPDAPAASKVATKAAE